MILIWNKSCVNHGVADKHNATHPNFNSDSFFDLFCFITEEGEKAVQKMKRGSN